MAFERTEDSDVQLIEDEIEALRQSVALTRTMLANMAMSSKDRDDAERLIANNLSKIAIKTLEVGSSRTGEEPL